MVAQRTLRKPIRATGVGFHTGSRVVMQLRPAPPDSGVRFRRTDLDEAVEIPAREPWLVPGHSATLEREGVQVRTVEHLLAAFAGLGIDNVLVELDAPEPPIMDGSASPLVFLIQSAGVIEQPASKRFVRIAAEVRAERNGRWARIRPSEDCLLSVEVALNHPVGGQQPQHAELDFSTVTFIKEISRARTYSLKSAFRKLHESSMGLGGTRDNVILLDDGGVVNPDGLRFANEFARHRLLDAFGMLYLLGGPFLGSFEAHRPSIGLLRDLLLAMERQEGAVEILEPAAQGPAPLSYLAPGQLGQEI